MALPPRCSSGVIDRVALVAAGQALTLPAMPVGVRLVVWMPMRAVSPFRFVMRAVPHLIEVIVGSGVPPQISGTVVRGIAIVVTALHAIGARTNERRQNQPVNLTVEPTAIQEQAHAVVLVSLVDLVAQNVTGYAVPNLSSIADFIAWESINRKPLLNWLKQRGFLPAPSSTYLERDPSRELGSPHWKRGELRYSSRAWHRTCLCVTQCTLLSAQAAGGTHSPAAWCTVTVL